MMRAEIYLKNDTWTRFGFMVLSEMGEFASLDFCVQTSVMLLSGKHAAPYFNRSCQKVFVTSLPITAQCPLPCAVCHMGNMPPLSAALSDVRLSLHYL